MKKYTLLNDFEKKSLLNHYKERNLVGIVPDVDDSLQVYYTFYFILNDTLCHNRILYCKYVYLQNKPNFSEFLIYADRRLDDSFFTLGSQLSQGKVRKKEIGEVARNLSWAIVSNLNSLYRNGFSNFKLDSITEFIVKNNCKDLLEDGISPLEIYKKYLYKYELEHKSLCSSIRDFDFEITEELEEETICVKRII